MCNLFKFHRISCLALIAAAVSLAVSSCDDLIPDTLYETVAVNDVVIKSVYITDEDYTCPFNVILPSDYETSGKKYPVLYLLHGMTNDNYSWQKDGDVVAMTEFAVNTGVIDPFIIVLPSAYMTFYVDDLDWSGIPVLEIYPKLKFESFFTKELQPYVEKNFPVLTDREHTAIAGLSMGGYGAWYLGMSAPDKFSKAASMSGALDLPAMVAMGDRPGGPAIWENIFGAQRNIADTESDLVYLYDRCVKNGKVPSLYQSCGTEDFLYPTNVAMRDCLQAKGADLFYSEGTGHHDWDFWDDRIKEMFDWMLGMK